ncbi:MAG: TetR/AcrR family transcriptional regulator [Henriciella sp.]
MPKQISGERRTQAERREQTQNLLIDAARTLFVDQGYAQTGMPELVRKAGVTRGALYHHYRDKIDLFRAVAEREAKAIAEIITTATENISDPDEAMIIGTNAYFDAMLVPGRVKILLSDAPSVLGYEAALNLTKSQGSASLKNGLGQAMPNLCDQEVDALTDILSAAFDRAALKIAEGGDRNAYTQALFTTIEKLLD